MSCNDVIARTYGGSDIQFKIRYKDTSGNYPDISDITAQVTGKIGSTTVFDISYPPTGSGTRIEFDTDSVSQYLEVIIEGEDTVGLTGVMNIKSVLDSANTGRRTEVNGIIELSDGGDL